MWVERTKAWLCDWDATPDFKQIVEKSLALFGVFTGVTLSFYIKDFLFGDNIPVGFKNFSVPSRILISAAVIALLLRYIVGSAVHLNATYVAQVTARIENNVLVEQKEPKSKLLGWLFFDILMLVIFGVLAVYIIYSIDLKEFLVRSAEFIGVGLSWSVVALALRPGDMAVAERWCVIDGLQLIITAVLYVTPLSDFWMTLALAAVYIFCLFLDFCVVSRPPLGAPADAAALAAKIAALDAERAALEAQLAALPPPPAAPPASNVAAGAAAGTGAVT